MAITTTGTTCMKYSEEERRKRRISSSTRRNRDISNDNTDCAVKSRSNTSSVIFWLWLVLILGQLRSLSAVRRDDMMMDSTQEESLARRVHQFRELASVHNSNRHKRERFVVVSDPSRLGSNKEKKNAKLFDDDKRRVHTGPNSLHN